MWRTSAHGHGFMNRGLNVVRRKGSHRTISRVVTKMVKIETIKPVVRGEMAPGD